jgi:hypothetical protein
MLGSMRLGCEFRGAFDTPLAWRCGFAWVVVVGCTILRTDLSSGGEIADSIGQGSSTVPGLNFC